MLLSAQKSETFQKRRKSIFFYINYKNALKRDAYRSLANRNCFGFPLLDVSSGGGSFSILNRSSVMTNKQGGGRG